MEQKTSPKSKSHYAFVILAGCCCLGAGGFGAIMNVVGVFVLPVTKSLGVGVGDWMVWSAIFSVMSIITLPLWGRALATKNFNVTATAAAAITIIPVFMFAFGTNVYWFWFWGGVIGCGFTCIATLILPTLIGNWFAENKRGKYLGIATAFTGIGTFVWSPLFTQLVKTLGWQTSYIIEGVIAALLILPFTAILFKLKPADKGLAPYGAIEGAEKINSRQSETALGITKKQAMHQPLFYIMGLLVFCVSVGAGFNTNLVAIASSIMSGSMSAEDAAVLGGWMISGVAIGNVVSKILFGIIADKAGIKTAFVMFWALFLAGLLIWLLIPNSTALIVGSVIFGANTGVVSVGLPILVRALYGNKDYAPIYSTLMTVNALVGGFSATVVGYVFQLTGSYSLAIIGAVVILVIGLVCFFAVYQSIMHATWKNGCSDLPQNNNA